LSEEIKEEKEITEGPNLLTPKKITLYDDDPQHITENKANNYDFPTLLMPGTKISVVTPETEPGPLAKAIWIDNFVEHSGDPVRSFLGKIWIYDENKGIRFATSHDTWSNYVPFNDYSIEPHKFIQHTYSFTREEALTIEYLGTEQFEKIVDMNKETFDPPEYRGVESDWHVDFTSEHAMPYEYSELEKLSSAIGTKAFYVKTNSNYTYLIPKYEELINSEPGKFKFSAMVNVAPEEQEQYIETLLPDIQAGIIDRVSADTVEHTTNAGTTTTTTNKLLTDMHLTLGGLIKDAFKTTLSDKGRLKQTLNKPAYVKDSQVKHNEGRYFEVWTKVMKKLLDKMSPSPMKLLWTFKSKLIPASVVPLLNEYDGRKFLYPMFNEIEFSTSTRTRIADLLSDFHLGYSILKTIYQGTTGKLLNHPETGKRGSISFANADKVYLASGDEVMIFGGSLTNPLRKGPAARSFRFHDSHAKDWLDRYFKEGYDFFAPKVPLTYINNTFPETDHALLIKPDSYPADSPPSSAEITLADLDNVENKFFKTIYSTIFKKRLAAIITEKTRSFKDILDGKKAYSETIAYRIEKWTAKDDQPDEMIQEIILQNTSKVDVLNYVDTQVRYEKEYIYKIYSWNMIFGTKYKYVSLPSSQNASGKGSTLIFDVEPYKRDIYRAASQLIMADIAQRAYYSYRYGFDAGTGTTDYPMYELLEADRELLEVIGCGAPVDYENYSYGNSASPCDPLGAKWPETPSDAGCCSSFVEASYDEFESQVFSHYTSHMWKVLGAGNKEYPLGFEDAHFDIKTRNYGINDPYQDLFSATLNSIIARRVKWMVDNGVAIESTIDSTSTLSVKGIGFRDGESWADNYWTDATSAEASKRFNAIIAVVGSAPSPLYDNVLPSGADKGLFGKSHTDIGVGFTSGANRAGSFSLPFLECHKFLRAFNLMSARPFTHDMTPSQRNDANSNPNHDKTSFGFPPISAASVDLVFRIALENYVKKVENYIEYTSKEKISMFNLPQASGGNTYEPDLLSEHLGNQGADVNLGAPIESEIEGESGMFGYNIDPKSISGQTTIKVNSRPHIKMIEVPYYTTPVMKVQDSPPLYPDVDIIPYKGFNDRVLFNFNSNTGEIEERPTLFTDEQYKKMYQRQYKEEWESKEEERAPIKFKSDDPVKEFIIRKSVTKPADILAFTKKNSTEIIIPSKGYSGASFVDKDIVPNKKYWYCFRTVDAHDHLSNPGPVYQVEIIDTDGAVYMLVELYKFEDAAAKKRSKQIKKSLRRYLHIEPHTRHTLLDEEKTFEGKDPKLTTAKGKNPVLGISEPSLFDQGEKQKFKIRLTSKDTGKKIDLNLRFVHQHQTEENLDNVTSPDDANG
jgi:hypothetical protein